jgi:hypothetical protein
MKMNYETDHEPERALDLAVALALGYTEHVFDYAYGGDSSLIVKANCWYLPTGETTWQGALPHFSTDLVTAMQLFAHVETAHGLLWTIDRWPDGYSISLILPANDPKLPLWAQAKDEWTSDDPSLPVAICTVCLKAIRRLASGVAAGGRREGEV